MSPVKFGLLGLGKITSRFAKVLQSVEDVVLTAVASRDPERTKVFAKQHKAKKALESYDDLINDKDVDVIYIGLTHNFHYEFAKKCLEAHKPVLCEKPLVTNEKEARQLVELAEKNNTLLMEAMWTRCLPAYRKAQEWVRSGEIGHVKLITANFCFRMDFDPNHRLFNKALAGGSIYDVGIYPIDFAMGIMNEHPESVTGSVLIAPTGVDESAAFSMRFASGALASLTCGFNVLAMEEAVIYGTSGRIVLENCFGPNTCTRYSEDGRKVLEKFKKPVRDGFEHEIRHCAELVRQGKIESDLIPWKDTIASAAIFDDLLHQWKIK